MPESDDWSSPTSAHANNRDARSSWPRRAGVSAERHDRAGRAHRGGARSSSDERSRHAGEIVGVRAGLPEHGGAARLSRGCIPTTVTWWLEVAPIFIGVPALILLIAAPPHSAGHTLIWFTAASGWSAAITPTLRCRLDFWDGAWFGFTRNHYDRIGHLAQGFHPGQCSRERSSSAAPRGGKPLASVSWSSASASRQRILRTGRVSGRRLPRAVPRPTSLAQGEPVGHAVGHDARAHAGRSSRSCCSPVQDRPVGSVR